MAAYVSKPKSKSVNASKLQNQNTKSNQAQTSRLCYSQSMISFLCFDFFSISLSQTTCWWSAPNHFQFQFSCSVVYSHFCDYTVHGIFQARILGNLPNPGIESKSPTLQADSLPAEPPGKPKNTGVGSITILQQIFPTQE